MGHLNFIAEEIVKFLTRCPVDLLDEIAPSIPQPAWDEYVMGTLTDTKMRESRPLAGGKPMPGMSGSGSGGGSGSGMGMGMGDDSSDSSDDDSDDDLGGRSKSTLGSFGTFGEPLKRTKAGDGFVHRGEGEGDEDEDDRVRAYVRFSHAIG
jgi:SIT4-associating protein SAP185/190